MKEDTVTCGTGPITLDVEMARRHGWSEVLINGVSATINLIARGASVTQSYIDGTACEACFARAPNPEHLPCDLCRRVASDKANTPHTVTRLWELEQHCTGLQQQLDSQQKEIERLFRLASGASAS